MGHVKKGFLAIAGLLFRFLTLPLVLTVSYKKGFSCWWVVEGVGGYILAGGGWCWVVVGGGGYILAGGGSWWIAVGRGGWWWVVALFSLTPCKR